jgi:hypothetical protein
VTVNEFVQPLGRAFLEFVRIATKDVADECDPASGSPARADLDAQDAMTDPNWPTPVLHIDSLGALAFHGALDHARTLATALAHMDPPPIFSDRTMLRPILEMDAVAMWLYEPGITTEQRILRSLRIDKDSAQNKANAAENMGAEGTTEVREARARQNVIDLYAKARRWPLKGTKRPRLADHVIVVMNSGPGSLAGTALWHLTSATSHGDSWVLAAALEEIGPNPATGQAVGALRIDPARVAQSIAIAVASIQGAAMARLAYLGVEPPEALIAAHREWARLWLLRDKEVTRLANQAGDG